MKKRSFIPIASLVVLSGAAAISGTFAWFQTNRALNLTFNDATVKSRDSNLIVNLDGSKNKTMTATPGNTDRGVLNLTLGGNAGSQFITDISGNGKNFFKLEQGYRPNDNTNKLDGVSWQIPTAIKDLDLSTAESADGYLIDFTLALSREELTTDAGRPLAVYLGSGTKIEPVTEVDSGADQAVQDAQAAQRVKDEKAVKGIRLAISNVDGSGEVTTPKKLITQTAELETYNRVIGYTNNDSTKPIYDNNFDNSPLYTYLTKTDNDSDKAYKYPKYKIVDAVYNDPENTAGEFKEVIVLDDLNNQGTAADVLAHNATTPDATYIDTISDAGTDKALKLNFRMWIEGTDAEVGHDVDRNMAVNGKVKLTLDLYTLHVGEQI